jgi:hypothetical protein
MPKDISEELKRRTADITQQRKSPKQKKIEAKEAQAAQPKVHRTKGQKIKDFLKTPGFKHLFGQSGYDKIKEGLLGSEGEFQQRNPYSPQTQAAMDLLAERSLPGLLGGLERQEQEYNQPLFNQLLGDQFGPLAQQSILPILMNLLSTQQSAYPQYGNQDMGSSPLSGILGGLFAQGGNYLGNYLQQNYGQQPMQQPPMQQQAMPQQMNPLMGMLNQLQNARR